MSEIRESKEIFQNEYGSTSQTQIYNEVFVFGSNRHSQIGLSENNVGKKICIPRFCSFNVVFTNVSCGAQHSIFLTRDGYVYTVGSNIYGQMGRGNCELNYSFAPSLVQKLQDQTIIKIVSGAYHNLALSNNREIFSWGRNKEGQLGIGQFISHQPDPTTVQSNSFNLLNKISTVQFFQTVNILFCKIANQDKAINIFGGWNHSFLITSLGEVHGFGSGNEGQLGQGNTENCNVPCKVNFENKHLITKIAVGENHSLFLNDVGQIFACGDNSSGQLGIGRGQKNVLIPQQINPENFENEEISDIDCSRFSIVVTKTTSSVYSWGQSFSPQSSSDYTPKLILSFKNQISQAENSKCFVRKIAAGKENAMLLTRKGDLYSWGKNVNGECGLSDFEDKSDSFHPLIFLKEKKILTFHMGESHTIVLGRSLHWRDHSNSSQFSQNSQHCSSILSQGVGLLESSLSFCWSEGQRDQLKKDASSDSREEFCQEYSSQGLKRRQFNSRSDDECKEQKSQIKRITQNSQIPKPQGNNLSHYRNSFDSSKMSDQRNFRSVSQQNLIQEPNKFLSDTTATQDRRVLPIQYIFSKSSSLNNSKELIQNEVSLSPQQMTESEFNSQENRIKDFLRESISVGSDFDEDRSEQALQQPQQFAEASCFDNKGAASRMKNFILAKNSFREVKIEDQKQNVSCFQDHCENYASFQQKNTFQNQKTKDNQENQDQAERNTVSQIEYQQVKQQKQQSLEHSIISTPKSTQISQISSQLPHEGSINDLKDIQNKNNTQQQSHDYQKLNDKLNNMNQAFQILIQQLATENCMANELILKTISSESTFKSNYQNSSRKSLQQNDSKGSLPCKYFTLDENMNNQIQIENCGSNLQNSNDTCERNITYNDMSLIENHNIKSIPQHSTNKLENQFFEDQENNLANHQVLSKHDSNQRVLDQDLSGKKSKIKYQDKENCTQYYVSDNNSQQVNSQQIKNQSQDFHLIMHHQNQAIFQSIGKFKKEFEISKNNPSITQKIAKLSSILTSIFPSENNDKQNIPFHSQTQGEEPKYSNLPLQLLQQPHILTQYSQSEQESSDQQSEKSTNTLYSQLQQLSLQLSQKEKHIADLQLSLANKEIQVQSLELKNKIKCMEYEQSYCHLQKALVIIDNCNSFSNQFLKMNEK